MPCGCGVKARIVCVWVAGKTVWSHCYTRAISECFSDHFGIIKRYTNGLFTLLLLTYRLPRPLWMCSGPDLTAHQHWRGYKPGWCLSSLQVQLQVCYNQIHIFRRKALNIDEAWTLFLELCDSQRLLSYVTVLCIFDRLLAVVICEDFTVVFFRRLYGRIRDRLYSTQSGNLQLHVCCVCRW